MVESLFPSPRARTAARRIAPFAAAALLAMASVLVPPGPAHPLELVEAAVLCVLIFAGALVIARRRRASWIEALPALAFLVVVALVRHAEGGAERSGFNSMALLPVLWLALYGTRAQLAACVGGVAVVFLAPLLLFGPPEYPVTEWRRAALWVLACTVVGVAVQRLVREVRQQAATVAAQAEQLGAGEQRYRSVVDNLDEIVFQTDPAGRFTFVSQPWLELTGFAPSEVLGRFFQDFVHPADRRRNGEGFRSLIEREATSFRHEIRLATWDGGCRWIQVTGRLTLDRNRLLGTSGTLADVTERREAQLGLEASKKRARAAEERFGNAFADAPIGMAFISLDGRFEQVNAALCALFGHSAAALERMTLWGLAHPEEREASRRAAQDLHAGEAAPGRRQTRWLRRDGTEVVCLLSLTPVRGEEGRPAQAFAQLEDITERTRAQEALALANRGLETRNRDVEAFASLQRDFVASSSHELRTPLTSILGYLEMVLESGDELPEQQRAHLQVAYRSSQRLLALVEDLLTVNRVDTGNLSVVPTPTGAAGLLQSTYETFAPLCRAKGVELELERPRSLPLFVDRARTEQVLANLVGNAAKFTPEGGKVSLSVTEEEDVACFTVADTGPGIAPDDLPLIFDRFFRTASAQEDAVPGTGLGLSIAKALTEAQGGALSVESVPGRGTTFTVTLPLAKEDQWLESSSSTTSPTS